MSSKGVKRKLSDRGDVVSDDTFPRGADGNLSMRQSLLNMSLDKFNTGRMMVEPSLRRSVLIANTLRVLQEEMRLENSRAPLLPGPTAPASLAAPPAVPPMDTTSLKEAPCLLVVQAHPHCVAEDMENVLFFTDDDFSLTSAISSILKDLEAVLDDGAPSQNHLRLIGNQDPERKPDISPSKCSSQSPLPNLSYSDEPRVGELKQVLAFDTCLSQNASPTLAGSVEDMDIELVGEIILGAKVCQGNPLDGTESRSPVLKPEAPPVPKDPLIRSPEARPPESVFGNFELMSSSYLKDLPLDDLFLDIDTSVFEREPTPAHSGSTSGRSSFYPVDDLSTFASSCNSASFASSQNGRDLNELDNIMEILVGS